MDQGAGLADQPGWAGFGGQEIEPTSWDECVNLLLSSGGSNLIYRGHRCFDWELETTLERALQAYAKRFDEDKYQLMLSMAADDGTDKWGNDVERELTQYFRRNAVHFGLPSLPQAWDLLGWWEVMQHHGAPTRLMDWSQSPFTALWFALEGHEEGCGDMALWIYDRRKADEIHAESMKRLRSASDYEILDDRQRQNRLVQLVVEDGNPALLPITPRQYPRSVAQQSVLTVSPSIGVGRPAHWWIRKRLAARVRLREKWKTEMLASCRSMGLSRPGLFRDLDSLGMFVNETFRNRAEMPETL